MLQAMVLAMSWVTLRRMRRRARKLKCVCLGVFVCVCMCVCVCVCVYCFTFCCANLFFVKKHISWLEPHHACGLFQVLEDWRYIAMVIDRLQLYIFLAVTITGTVGILINAPHIFEYVDQEKVIESLKGSKYGKLEEIWSQVYCRILRKIRKKQCQIWLQSRWTPVCVIFISFWPQMGQIGRHLQWIRRQVRETMLISFTLNSNWYLDVGTRQCSYYLLYWSRGCQIGMRLSYRPENAGRRLIWQPKIDDSRSFNMEGDMNISMF